MDAIDLLKKDHAKVATLFQRFNDGGGLTGVVKRLTGNAASPRQRRSAAEQICRELDVHAIIEETTFYPAVRALRDERLDDMLDEAQREQGSIKDGVQESRAVYADDERLRTAMATLQQCVEHHVREEENEMFPLVEERMPEGERAGLGRELAARKRAQGATAPRPKKTIKRAAARTRPGGRQRARKTTAKVTKARTRAKARAGRRR